jgi:hypothetical protein
MWISFEEEIDSLLNIFWYFFSFEEILLSGGFLD